MPYGLDSTATSAASTGGTGNWWDWFTKSDASGTPNYLSAAQLALGAYNTLKKPSYQNVPLSPEERAIYQLYMGQANDPRTKDNRAQAADFAKGQLGAITPNLPWNRSTPFSMAYMGLTPPTNLNQGGGGGSNYLLQLMGGKGAPNGYPARDRIGANGGQAGLPASGVESGQRQPFMRQWSPAEGDSGQPEYGQDIGSWMQRNPQGANPSTYESAFPTRGGPNDPNAPANQFADTNPAAKTSYSNGPEVAGFAQWLNSQGVKDASRIAIALFTGGLAGAALAAARTLWNHYQSTKSTTSATPSTSGKPQP